MATVTAADGATLAYEVIGDEAPDETFVLVHGITESGAAWDPVTNRLAPAGCVITVDLRGHGASERKPPYDVFTMASDLHTVLQAVGADDALVIGHSLGGMVVSAYAAAGHPARGIVNVDQALDTSGFKQVLTRVEPALRGSHEEFMGVIDPLFSMLYEPLPESERARVHATASPEQDVVLGVWELVLSSSTDDLNALITSVASAIKVPYLSLHGSDDAEYQDWLTARMPSVTYETWPDHGHFLHLVDPDRFVARVEAFNEECTP